jgi:ferritin-like metal-binding protein YciE
VKQQIDRDALRAGVAELEQLKEQTEKEYKANQEQVEALKQVGKQLQADPNRSMKDAGKEIEKAAQNTSKALDKSTQDTRHSIEKANKWISKSIGIRF